MTFYVERTECGSDFHVATLVRPSDHRSVATWKSLPHSPCSASQVIASDRSRQLVSFEDRVLDRAGSKTVADQLNARDFSQQLLAQLVRRLTTVRVHK